MTPGKLSVLAAVLLTSVVCRAAEPPAAQWSGDDYRNATLRRHKTCVENEQYSHQGLCCLNCQAGTYVHKACERDLELGTCLSCEQGQTYTEHPNGMNRCLACSPCRSDETEVDACTTTAATKCQCKSGTFCVPEQACEVCKRCAKCKSSEETVKECTASSNTMCRKRDPAPPQTPSVPSTPTPANSHNIVVPVVIILGVLVIVAALALTAWWFGIKKKSCGIPCVKTHSDHNEIVKIPIDESNSPTPEEQQNDENAGLEGEESRPESRPLLQETQSGMTKASSPLEDEDRGLGDSLPNTTSSSQTSLSALPTAASSGSTPQQSPTAVRLTSAILDNPLQQRLVPALGSDLSLKKSFDLFDEDLDVRFHNKFFRLIGVSDNQIRMAENGSLGSRGDKVYELLKHWMQRQGLKADINDLLDALLSLDQRSSAENIATKALQRGYYRHAP